MSELRALEHDTNACTVPAQHRWRDGVSLEPAPLPRTPTCSCSCVGNHAGFSTWVKGQNLASPRPLIVPAMTKPWPV